MSNKISTSPVSGLSYRIPDSAADTEMSGFLERNEGRSVIAIQGLGFVGFAMLLVVANSKNRSQYAAVGVDLASADAYWKVGDINGGYCPVISSDPSVDCLYKDAKKLGNIIATTDPLAYQYASVVIVDINLDVVKSKDGVGHINDYDVPMRNFEGAIRSIGKNCRPDALILVETTVPPGTCSKIVKPILLEELKKRGLDTGELKIGHSYERVMPGPEYINSIKNFYRVYAGVDESSADAVEDFLKTIISTDEYPLTRLKNTESTEMAKVLENSYRAMNISFMVEWSRFAESAGVNLYSIVDAIRMRPTHSNLMYPGIGVGGYCLTKDPVMASWSSEQLFGLESGLRSSVRAVEINDLMPSYAFDFTARCIGHQLNSLRFVLLGVAYGPGIGDTRCSPVGPYMNHLLSAGAQVSLIDPYVSNWPEANTPVLQSLDALVDVQPSVVVITTGHVYFIEDDRLYNWLEDFESAPILIDTVGLISGHKLGPKYRLGENFFALGVGH